MLNLRRKLNETIIILNKSTNEKIEILVSEINGGDVLLSLKDDELNYTILRGELEK